MNRKQVLTLSITVLFFLISCNLVTATPISTLTTDPQTQIAQAVAGTAIAQTQAALHLQKTMAAIVTNTTQPTYTTQRTYTPQPTYTTQPTYTIQFTNTPQFTYTPQFTFTPEFTFTSGTATVSVSVSVNTNCRTGPGDAYAIIGALQVGQTAEVVGRSQYSDNWIIKLPSSPTVLCWLWGQWATVTGNTNSLPVYQPPSTPTKTTSPFVTLGITNNSAQDILYVFFSLTSDPAWGSDRLGADTLNIGETFYWSIPPGQYDIKVELAGHVVYYQWNNVNIFSNMILTIQ